MSIQTVHLFFTASGSRLSKLAIRATGGPWGHVGILFVETARMAAFEARSEEGFVGPFEIEQTRQFVEQRSGEMLISHALPLDSEQAAEVYKRALAMRRCVTYSKWQLVALFGFLRYGLKIDPSPKAVVCSEAVARLLWPYVDLRSCNAPSFDAATPYSVYARLCEIEAGYGASARAVKGKEEQDDDDSG